MIKHFEHECWFARFIVRANVRKIIDVATFFFLTGQCKTKITVLLGNSCQHVVELASNSM